ncbi:MAG: GMC family oxidoreductase, partial [Planctomycetales bacterium]|nr:GMC family oxidoreductase [Planctomycetales bacterium]
MECDFDVAVIGSGAGGAAFAHACATAGKSVLVVERGRRPSATHAAHDERATLIEKQPYDDRPVRVNAESVRLYMGGVLGGGTSLFGAVMLRPSADDFHPGRHYGDRLPRSEWDWPICYDELAPYYDQAERLFRVAATRGDDYDPLQRPHADVDARVLPIAPVNERLMAANRAQGLRPMRLPLAIDTRQCERCASCAGFLCPHGARRSAAQLLDDAAADHLLHVATNTEVERI